MLRKLIQDLPVYDHLHIIMGAFDGVHLAHQKIIADAVKIAHSKEEASLIFTFEPLPKEFFQHEHFIGRLTPAPVKKKFLNNFHADHVIVADFDILRHMSEKEFIETLLAKGKHITFYSGDDFRLGALDGESYGGDRISYVKETELSFEGRPCRATEIRKLLRHGEIITANKLLGRPYTIYSVNEHGDQLGRQIGFPTINITPNHQVIPQNGVYFTSIHILNQTYHAMTYIGNRPTVNGLDLRIEAHILEEFKFDLKKDTNLELSFLEKISDEKKFKSLEELTEMLYNYKQISLGLATKRL
ncbi:MAG: riboflavin kinase [Brevinema sp.]